MKEEHVILTKEEIFEELDRILRINKKNIRKQLAYDNLNTLLHSEASVDYLPIIEKWASKNGINLTIIDCKDKDDYSQYELDGLKKDNAVLVVKNIYDVNTNFLNRRLLSTIENHYISNIVFENLLFVIGLNNYSKKRADTKLISLFGHKGYKYIED